MSGDVLPAKEARDRQLTAIRDHYGNGRHTFDECAVCGWLGWTSTNQELPDEIVITEWTPGSAACPICREVQVRSPELYRWALGVTAKLRRLVEERDHAR